MNCAGYGLFSVIFNIGVGARIGSSDKQRPTKLLARPYAFGRTLPLRADPVGAFSILEVLQTPPVDWWSYLVYIDRLLLTYDRWARRIRVDSVGCRDLQV